MDGRGHQSTPTLTQIPIKDIRDLSTGVHLCYLLHHLTDGKFKLGKVAKYAKTEAEYFKNLRLFNEGLENCQIQEKFDVLHSKIRSTVS